MVEEATAFLLAQFERVRRLCTFPGVENVTLDFGIARRRAVVQCDYLPPELVRIAGSLGLGIELSHYPETVTDLENHARPGVLD